MCVAFRPDGNQICSGTIRGLLRFWNVEDGSLVCEIDGQKDIKGGMLIFLPNKCFLLFHPPLKLMVILLHLGRKINDRMTADNNASSRYFTSIAYSADGTCLLAGGNSKYVCIYEISQQILLKKFTISFNRSLDGVLDEVSSALLAFSLSVPYFYNQMQLNYAPLTSDSSIPRTSEMVVLLTKSTTQLMKILVMLPICLVPNVQMMAREKVE